MEEDFNIYKLPPKDTALTQADVQRIVNEALTNYSQPTKVSGGYFQSENFVSGSAGWQFTPTSAQINVSTAIKSLDIPDTTTVNSFHVNTSGDTWWGATTFGAAVASVSKAGAVVGSSFTITGGSINGVTVAAIPNNATTDISLLEWTTNIAFTSASATQINWGTGTIALSNGRTFSITASNTGAMAAATYIYLDTGVSSTALQTTTTYSTAMGANKILIAVAQNNTVAASVVPMGGGLPILDGVGNIAALSITAASIAASTITAAKMSVSQLSAIAADMGSLTAGNIVLSSGGFIRSGQTAYNTGTGFYMGNDSGTPRFSIGTAGGNRVTWDGTTLTVIGNQTNVQTFSTAGAATWTKPEGAQFVEIVCIGGGGGGGSGRYGTPVQHNRGGGGGGAGAVSKATIAAASLGTTVSITVGAAGVGGAAVTTSPNNGNDGTNGGSSSFGSLVLAGGGGGGIGGGLAVNGSGGGSGGIIGSGSGNTGGTPDAGAANGISGQGADGPTTDQGPGRNCEYGGGTGGNGSADAGLTAGAGGSSIFAAGGGGGGGGISSGGVQSAGGAGGTVQSYSSGGGGAGGAAGGGAGTAGTAQSSLLKGYGGSGGGGGGGRTDTGVAGAGAVGGLPGGGGGGGGGNRGDGGGSGAGGNGAVGTVIVTAYL